MNENLNIDHLYNCYLRTGMERMPESEVIRRFGKNAFEDYGDHIDHSEWCSCNDKPVIRDPFLGTMLSEPPF